MKKLHNEFKAIAENEISRDVRIPSRANRSASAYRSLRRKPVPLAAVAAAAFLLPLCVAAQTKEARTALVVGCDYTGTSLELPSPIADAKALAEKLETQLGFQVTLLKNPNRKQLIDETERFGEELGKRGGVGLFYFSGHGAQHEGENYLIPAGASLSFREDLPTEAVTAGRMVTRMDGADNRISLLFLDACRDNSLPSSRKKATPAKGLSGMNAARGMLIGFATARNTVANDSGTGSYYTNALLKHIATPNISVTDMLTKVNSDVRKVSGGTQVPFMEVGLSDVFAFVPGVDTSRRRELKPSPSQGPVSPGTATKEAPFLNSLGMEFVPVPGTQVLMCVHETRKEDYTIYATSNPGVNGEWKQEPGEYYSDNPKILPDRHPVTVSWNDAKRFCSWLSKKEGRQYRLPSDHEWSCAVGIGSQESATASQREKNGKASGYPWGRNYPPVDRAGNYADETRKTAYGEGEVDIITGYRDGYARTAPVKSFNSNRLGIFDLGGNVREWCEDSEDPADNILRVTRGESYSDGEAETLRSSYRRYLPPEIRTMAGFRCVLVRSGD